MQYVNLPGNGLGSKQVSVLGLGCGAMLGRCGRRESLAALGAAWDAGINFFDTARSYGYGESERLLGEFLTGERRQRAVVCTKFGILPAARNWKQRVKPLAQAAVRLFPGLRRMAQRQAAGQMVRGEFSVELLRTSLETSLRELRMERVDMLLLHAAPLSVLEQDDLLEALERLVEAGTVGMAGISGEREVMAASFARGPRGLRTAQFAVTPGFENETRKAAAEGWFLVGNHPFGGPGGAGERKRRIEALRGDERLPAGLREKLTPEEQLLPEVMLNMILCGTGAQAVIPAMMRPEHLKGNVRAVESCRFSAEELERLRAALV